MSVEFRVEGPQEQLEEGLQAWLGNTAFELIETPLFDDANLSGLLVTEGSTRGLAVFLNPGRCDVRLSALASRVDWRMAAELFGAFAGDAITLTCEGQPFTLGDWEGSGLEEAWRRDFEVSLAALHSSELTEVLLPLMGPLALGLSKPLSDDLTSGRETDPVAVERRLASELAPVLSAYWASTMVLTGDLPMATWAGIYTVVHGAKVIAPGFLTEQGVRGLVPIDALAEILGERITSLGEGNWLLPELGDEPELKQQITDAAIDVEVLIAQAQADKPRKVLDPTVLKPAMREFTVAIHQGIPFEQAQAHISDAYLIPEPHMRVFSTVCGEAYMAAQEGLTDVEAGLARVRERMAGLPLPPDMVEGLVRRVYTTLDEIAEAGY